MRIILHTLVEQPIKYWADLLLLRGWCSHASLLCLPHEKNGTKGVYNHNEPGHLDLATTLHGQNWLHKLQGNGDLSLLDLLGKTHLKVAKWIWRLQASYVIQQWMKVVAGEHILTVNTVSVQDKAQCLWNCLYNCCILIYCCRISCTLSDHADLLPVSFWDILLKQNSSTFVSEGKFAV